jgi:putative addiction module component (TIGR02574 family)
MLTHDIQEKVRNLRDLEKIHLIEMLMDDLDIPDPEVEKLWIEESEQRYKAYKEGKVKAIPLDVIKERYSK